uniref:SAP domain-containing protein n=1 Tax=Octopus bimaculoides TaxID=37653 RepID=A0A0L8I7X3_OCTBM
MDIKQLDDSAIEVLTVPELKKYLRLYGQYVTGRKADLIEKLKAKQQLRSGIFYHDRHVHSIEYHDVSESCSHCIVRCLTEANVQSSITIYCLEHECPVDEYIPVCSENGMSFKSPCSAGCRYDNLKQKKFFNCTCAGTNQFAIHGRCLTHCDGATYTLVLLALRCFLIGAILSAMASVKVSCTSKTDRTVAMSIMTLFSSLFDFDGADGGDDGDGSGGGGDDDADDVVKTLALQPRVLGSVPLRDTVKGADADDDDDVDDDDDDNNDDDDDDDDDARI